MTYLDTQKGGLSSRLTSVLLSRLLIDLHKASQADNSLDAMAWTTIVFAQSRHNEVGNDNDLNENVSSVELYSSPGGIDPSVAST